ncbi:ArsR family transcriptional regulator (plasmid) [Haloferax mediterranei ATCC 33500]|uniref:Transcriptional regulator n=1 Tax=Haloferax mediterranei (strain ATCC 33500 / DSM 1411 / JCM 8866 / NBRC 14739 / NCIMB 2177 / R-4) TaxID=523841 RepID=I3RA18_HALMT|nr:helix-turn-helix domain-containing protein [Haloferax mediterranei]AFK21078.1 HTH DNA binding domain-containing protein [Haloferax mediterranei ATCC 33500]AHZ24066.1 transcriptional regulator [Haloferax mediterranei ATCC 33500]EMA05139.1 HTH DNA binding domain-containing protein [Haloferax mediterranei ATCC 33500]MDX5989784.1 helix-turn-helix domain-containing protein [Haloferax mediterranei ATCC 33500]QCQ77228.1 ArsR family transcriptional regulator [Haloferax mediterranei ATCC 33500]
MHSITLRVSVEDDFHPANRLLAEDPSISRERIRSVTTLDDGSIVLLYHLRGDLTRVRKHLTNHRGVIESDVPDGTNGLVYIHGRPTVPIRELFDLARTHEVIFEPPFTHIGDALELRMVGEERTLSQVAAAIPSEIDLTLVRKGPYRPETRTLGSKLTSRQREVLAVAVERGYYESPRETTHEEIAAHLGVTTATVSEHLRKIERRVLSALVNEAPTV